LLASQGQNRQIAQEELISREHGAALAKSVSSTLAEHDDADGRADALSAVGHQ